LLASVWVVGVLALVFSVLPGLPAHAQPADESAAAMDARLAAATVTRVGPSYLIPVARAMGHSG